MWSCLWEVFRNFFWFRMLQPEYLLQLITGTISRQSWTICIGSQSVSEHNSWCWCWSVKPYMVWEHMKGHLLSYEDTQSLWSLSKILLWIHPFSEIGWVTILERAFFNDGTKTLDLCFLRYSSISFFCHFLPVTEYFFVLLAFPWWFHPSCPAL